MSSIFNEVIYGKFPGSFRHPTDPSHKQDEVLVGWVFEIDNDGTPSTKYQLPKITRKLTPSSKNRSSTL